MHILQIPHGFQFDDDFVFHNQIQSMSADLFTPKENHDLLLSDVGNSAAVQGHLQGSLVNGLKIPRSQLSMHLKPAAIISPDNVSKA